MICVPKRICGIEDLSEFGKEISHILYNLCYSENKETYVAKAKELWEKLSLDENGFHFVKIKAILTKTVNILFEIRPNTDSKTNQIKAMLFIMTSLY